MLDNLKFINDRKKDLTKNYNNTKSMYPANKEWQNSVYHYNESLIKNIPITDKAANKLIRGYFHISKLIKGKKSKRIHIRLRRLSLNRILVSKPNMKQTNNKVIITVFLYNKKKNYIIHNIKKKHSILPSTNSEGLKNKKNNKKLKLNKSTLKPEFNNRLDYNKLSLKLDYINKDNKLNTTNSNDILSNYDETVENKNLLKNKINVYRDKLISKDTIVKHKYYNYLPIKTTKFLDEKGLLDLLTKNFLEKKKNNLIFNLNHLTYKNNVKDIINNEITNVDTRHELPSVYSVKSINKFNSNKYNESFLNTITSYFGLDTSIDTSTNTNTSAIASASVSSNVKANLINSENLNTSINAGRDNNKSLNTVFKPNKLNSFLHTDNIQNTELSAQKKTMRYLKDIKIYNSYLFIKQINKILLNYTKNFNDVTLKYKYISLISKYYSIFFKYSNSNYKSVLDNMIFSKNNNNNLYLKSLPLNSKFNNYLLENYTSNNNKNNYASYSYQNLKPYMFNIRLYNNKIYEVLDNAKSNNEENLQTEFLPNYVNFNGNIIRKLKSYFILCNINKIYFDYDTLNNKDINIKRVKSVKLPIENKTKKLIKQWKLLLKKVRKQKLFLLRVLKWNNSKFSSFEFNYFKNFVKLSYNNELFYLHYIKMLSFNNNIFKLSSILGLSNSLSKLYNKKIEFNLVNLKYMYLNSDILTESVVTRLRKKGNRYINVLNRVLRMVSIPTKFRYYTKPVNSTCNIVKSNNIQKTVISSIKNKHIFGVRFEAAGRLSKRLTASRSVFTIKYKGSIRNPDSSFNGISSKLLRNHHKSNVQYTFLKNKTRNGSFGLKGWMSGY